MTLRRAEEAENESKARAVLVRMGVEAHEVIKRAAKHRGHNLGRYMREASVAAAILDTQGLPDPDPIPEPEPESQPEPEPNGQDPEPVVEDAG